MKHRKVYLISVYFFTTLFLFSNTAYCNRGCCSHHGGVCGETCCDGTSLSAKCRDASESSNPSSSSYVVPAQPIYNSTATKPPEKRRSENIEIGRKSEVTETGYDRKDWPHWIDADDDCQDTRAEILIRDNIGTIKYKRNTPCNVSWGKWLCPYTGKVFEKASDMDIDHIVPLAHAYKTGGAKWPRSKKRDFANDPLNLIAVEDNINQAKGDKAPDEWRPPRREFWHEYADRWRRVKLKYGLQICDSERKALTEMMIY